jgi:hypothetical protein
MAAEFYSTGVRATIFFLLASTSALGDGTEAERMDKGRQVLYVHGIRAGGTRR